MKILSGFITNSSSTSFLVCFDKKPESVLELQKILFGDETKYSNPHAYSSNDTKSWPVEMVSEIVFNDLSVATDEEIHEFVKSYVTDYNEVNVDDFRSESEINWERYNQARSKIIRKKVTEFFKINKMLFLGDKFICILSYSDNDGSLYSAMEHGELFHKVKHFRDSRH